MYAGTLGRSAACRVSEDLLASGTAQRVGLELDCLVLS